MDIILAVIALGLLLAIVVFGLFKQEKRHRASGARFNQTENRSTESATS
ncbi:hypothetical protein [Jannaschia sp. LMIT008]|nr:hypothetical protein [Jannaschia sp. LMIT008]